MKNISPHVEIYKFPITALSSITNRVTGLYLTGIFMGSGIVGLVRPTLLSDYKELDNKYKNMFEYTILFSSTFHIFGGLRHFIWDKYPALLNNKAVTKSSIYLICVSMISSFVVDNIRKKVK